MARYFFDDLQPAFAVREEEDTFRLMMNEEDIDEDHVEDFLDTTVEWLSTNPKKGILIDFKGVKSVCPEFVVHLNRYYEEIKGRGIVVRMVNVDPAIKPFVDVSSITVVIDVPYENKPVVSAKKVLQDLAHHLTDEDLKKKYELSDKGLESLFRKLLRKGLVSRKTLVKRQEMFEADITVRNELLESHKASVDAAEAVRDINKHLSDAELMEKYRLSEKGLKSLFRKLVQKGLISERALQRRQKTLTLW